MGTKGREAERFSPGHERKVLGGNEKDPCRQEKVLRRQGKDPGRLKKVPRLFSRDPVEQAEAHDASAETLGRLEKVRV